MFKSKEMRDTILAYKRFFDTADGKLIFGDMIKSCHFLDSSFTGNPQETAFNEGARSVLLRILKTTNTSIPQLDEFIKQMEAEEQENDY